MIAMGDGKAASYISTIAHAGSISAAAAELGISQPALSAFLKKKEGFVGSAIFDRSSTPLALTDAGRAYLDYEAGVSGLKRELARKVSDIEGLRCGELSVGGVGTFNIAYLPQAVSKFASRYPGIDISILDGTAPEMAQAALDGEIDLVIAPFPQDNAAFECRELMRERIFLCVPPKWPVVDVLPPIGEAGFARIDAQGISRLGDCVFVSMLEEQFMGKKLASLLDSAGLKPKQVIKTNQMLTCLAMTMEGVGVSLVTESALAAVNLSEKPALYLADREASDRVLYIATPRNRSASLAAREFAAILEETLV